MASLGYILIPTNVESNRFKMNNISGLSSQKLRNDTSTLLMFNHI